MKTDLSDLDGGERETYEEELGSEALDAALRIRDRIVNSPADRPARRSTSATASASSARCRSSTAFKQIRDFLAANPDEVVVIVIEDYVEPADIDAAVRESGLIDYVYDGALDPRRCRRCRRSSTPAAGR